MDVLIYIDEKDFWAYPVGAGKNLAQTVIDNCVESRGVQRLIIIRSQRWVEGVTGRAPLFTLPSQTVLKSTTIWASQETLEKEIYSAFRLMNLESAVVLTSATPYVMPFMLDEVFDKTNNAVLFSTSWADLVKEKATFGQIELPTDPESLTYIYNEMYLGASWEDILEEFNGKQSSIL